jgi:hypothetical protein
MTMNLYGSVDEIGQGLRQATPREDNNQSYPFLQARPSTHRMCAHDYLFHTNEYKVFTDSQML